MANGLCIRSSPCCAGVSPPFCQTVCTATRMEHPSEIPLHGTLLPDSKGRICAPAVCRTEQRNSPQSATVSSPPFPYLVHTARCRQVHEVAIKLPPYQFAILYILAHHSRPVHRRRKRGDEEDTRLTFLFHHMSKE